jgi:hypothetical protein
MILTAASFWPQLAVTQKLDPEALPPPVRDPHSIAADLVVPLCPATFNDSLETDGIAPKGDKSVTPPKSTHMANARFSDEARRQKQIKQFQAILSLVVDTSGMPQALEAVQQYRFASAMKDGKPVAVRIYVEVKFHLY